MGSDGECDRRSKRRREEDLDWPRHQHREPRDRYELGRNREPRDRADDRDKYHGCHREHRGRDDDRHEYHGHHREPRGRDDDRYEYHGRHRESRGRDDDHYEYHGRHRDRGRHDYDSDPYEYHDRSRLHRSCNRHDPHLSDGRDPGCVEGEGGPKRESDHDPSNTEGCSPRKQQSHGQKSKSGWVRNQSELPCDDKEHDKDTYASVVDDAMISALKCLPMSTIGRPPTTASVMCSEADSTKIVQPPSVCLLLKIAFDQIADKKKSDPKYIRYDILQKCARAGGVDHIHVDTKNGVVYLRFRTITVAKHAKKIFEGAYYEGSLITTGFMDFRRYCQKFPIKD